MIGLSSAFGILRNPKVVLVIVILLVIAAGVYYYKDTQNKLQMQAAEIAIKEVQLAQQEKIIENIKTEVRQQQAIITRLNKEFATARNQVDILRRKFDKIGNSSKVTRDIGKLAIAKPKLIERVINNGTKDALRCIEIVSGAPLTDAERAATKKSQINSACPELANPNYLPY